MHEKKIVNNSLISIIYKIMMLLLGFITRKIFIIYLGEEILGLNSMYSNLLDLLNLADLGIGVAVQYQLYEPLVKKDYKKLSKIITAARQIYNRIGFFILVIGGILSFFVHKLIKDNIYPIWFVQISFIISVIGIAIGYFFVHKRLFLQADEELGLVNIIDFFAKIITTILALVTTIILGNYFIYLVINATYGLIGNLIIHIIFEKKYPQIKSDIRDIYDEKKEIKADLKHILPMKLSNYVYNSTDNLIISKLLGLMKVAMYSNYMTIINGLMGMEYMFGNVVASSMGKIVKEEGNKDKIYKYYLVFQYGQYIFTSFCTVTLIVLCQPFVGWWVGEQLLLSNEIVMLLILDFYIHSMYQPAYVMFGATGRFKNDKNITIASAIMNIVISIILVNIIGVSGVIIGTICTDIYIWVVRTCQIVKGYFQQNIWQYLLKMVKYTILTVFIISILVYICSRVTFESMILEMLVKAAVCFFVANVINLALTCKNEECSYIFKILQSRIMKGKIK